MKNFRQILRIFLPLVAVACAVLFIPWTTLRLWISPLPSTVQKQVEQGVDYGLNGIIVYIEKKGLKPEFHTSGFNNRVTQLPVNPHALFKIASISKLYIAAASAKLISENVLSLEKSLAEYLPELSDHIENSDQINLRMMLQHRSGIPEFITEPNLPWSNLPNDPAHFLNLVLDKPADFKPDGQFAYSNTNYLLIARIMDKVLKYSHHDYIRNYILTPLGLKSTYNVLAEADINVVTSGYYSEYEGDLKTQNFVVPGGSMVATAQDLGIFLRALSDGLLLNEKEQALYSSFSKFEHTGLLPGYSSIARYEKDIDAVVVMFVNTSGANTWSTVEILFNRVVRILHE
ncbi:MAG: class A beta-lactamase-related serine hydrolase [Pedobacter sp.]|nr:MAG: class A beta-lactamase-related serine hydrolase [Pedobacter sp.]